MPFFWNCSGEDVKMAADADLVRVYVFSRRTLYVVIKCCTCACGVCAAAAAAAVEVVVVVTTVVRKGLGKRADVYSTSNMPQAKTFCGMRSNSCPSKYVRLKI